MSLTKFLQAFNEKEFEKAHTLLASKVATMLGRKLEEGDWIYVYCKAKNIPYGGWSNLNTDIVCDGLGVEQKLLCVHSDRPIKESCGTTKMHPSATRSIRIKSLTGDPTDVARDVLRQYAEFINNRKKNVAKTCSKGEDADLRTGWLLWQETLREFLYWEEEMKEPNPEDYYAEWVDSGGGTRKVSRNLWVYEKSTGRKKYSITTSAGAKIQPYFDVPPPDNPNLFYFCVQGEELDGKLIRIWVTHNTALLLKQYFGELDASKISQEIINIANTIPNSSKGKTLVVEEVATPLIISYAAYKALKMAFDGVSDEHSMQLFVRKILS